MAFEYCVDRQTIVQNILDGDAELISSVIPASVQGFDSNLPLYEYNPEKAKEYLEKSDYDGRKITFLTSNIVKKAEDVALFIADNMKAAGFNVEIEIIEYPPFVERRSIGRYDLLYQQIQNPGNDASEALSLRFDLPGEGHHYVNAELHDLIGKLMREMDANQRASYVTRISHLMREEAAPSTGIGSANLVYYADWGVTGIRFFRDGTVRVMYVDYDPTLKAGKD
jgi:ABC-type transport system substrate-binding protein